jgi:hypothetical protein
LDIDGFFFSVGVANPSVFAFAAPNVGASAPGGADPGLFPAVAAGGVSPNINGEFGPVNPFIADSHALNPVNGPGVHPLPPAQGILQQWGFEQFYNNPFTAYVARYYSNTPADAVGALPKNFFTRFDVFSPFGPVPGAGGVDPLSLSPNFFGIDDGLGDLSNLITSPSVTPCDPAAQGDCDTSLPTGTANFTLLGPDPNGTNSPIPEPVTAVPLAAASLALASRAWRRRRT